MKTTAKYRVSKAQKLPLLVKNPLHAILLRIARNEGRRLEWVVQENLVTGIRVKYPAYREELDQMFAEPKPENGTAVAQPASETHEG